MNSLSNDDSVLSENEPKPKGSILKRKLTNNSNKSKLSKNDSDSMISSKKQLLDESTIDMLDDNTLDGFSNDDNTNAAPAEDDDESSQISNSNRVSFNLKDTQDLSENSASQQKDGEATPSKKRKRRKSAFHVDRAVAFSMSASQLFAYKWPQDESTSCELFVLQEQVTDFLDVKSFKRKFPDLFRRQIDLKEREYLVENKIVSEMQGSLGLTALKLSEVLDIMSQEYPDKYKEFNEYLNEKRKMMAATQVVRRKSETFRTNKPLDATRMKELIIKAAKSASEYNSQLQKEKKEERNTFFDLHTMRIQVPKNQTLQLKSELTQPGSYPVPLIHGQYQDYYKKYTSDELKYLPLNTCLYTLPKPTAMLYSEWKHSAKSMNINQNSSDDETDYVDNVKPNTISTTPVVSIQRIDSPKPVIAPKPEPIITATCYICQKSSTSDQLIHCSSCVNYSHPHCLELNPSLVSWSCIRNYSWQCMECKICSTCKKSHDEDKMMFCDRCDRGYHTYCVGVKDVPSGSWLCLTCKSNEHKSTPVKMKINAILSSSSASLPQYNTPNTSISSPAKRGRPVGSLNKPKTVSQLQKEMFQKGPRYSIDSDSQSPTKKSRGRPKKNDDNSATGYASNTNSKDEFQMDHDDEHSLNSYNYTNTCVIDDNISNQFYAFN